MTRRVLLAAADGGLGERGLQLGHGSQVRLVVGAELRRARVDPARDHRVRLLGVFHCAHSKLWASVGAMRVATLLLALAACGSTHAKKDAGGSGDAGNTCQKDDQCTAGSKCCQTVCVETADCAF